jgi:hypothetical protein
VKTCTRCGETKPFDQFPPRRRGQPRLQSWCRACFAANNARYYREHEAAQKARLARNTAVRRGQNHLLAIAYLLQHPCVDCGEADIVVLQFDHFADKEANVSALIGGAASWSRIEREIKKCEVRCANCHRLKTAKAWSAPAIDDQSLVPAPARLQERPTQLRLKEIDLRTCRVCGQERPLSQFPLRSLEKQTRQWICLACQRAYTKRWYYDNRQRSIAGARKRNMTRRRIAHARVGGMARACADCGETNPLLIDFDHMWDKRANVSYMVHAGFSWQTITAEMDKCEIRCANCHARKTARDQGSYKTKAVGL